MNITGVSELDAEYLSKADLSTEQHRFGNKNSGVTDFFFSVISDVLSFPVPFRDDVQY